MDNNLHIFKTERPNDDSGFVLITALMVIFLILTLVTTVALITASDLRSAAKARAVITTQFMAESVADSVYAAVAREETKLFEEAAQKSLFVNMAPFDDGNYPLKSATPGDFGNWFLLNSDGKVEKCEGANLKETCFKARISNFDTDSLVLKKKQILVEIVARGACLVDGLNVSGCVYRKFNQVYRTKIYIEDVSINENENASPSVGTRGTKR